MPKLRRINKISVSIIIKMTTLTQSKQSKCIQIKRILFVYNYCEQ